MIFLFVRETPSVWTFLKTRKAEDDAYFRACELGSAGRRGDEYIKTAVEGCLSDFDADVWLASMKAEGELSVQDSPKVESGSGVSAAAVVSGRECKTKFSETAGRLLTTSQMRRMQDEIKRQRISAAGA